MTDERGSKTAGGTQECGGKECGKDHHNYASFMKPPTAHFMYFKNSVE